MDKKVAIVMEIESCDRKSKEEIEKMSPDMSIVKVMNTQMITLKDMPMRQRNEMRGQFMCRLVLQMKNRDNCYMKKEDVVYRHTSYSNLTSGDNGDVSDKVKDDSSIM